MSVRRPRILGKGLDGHVELRCDPAKWPQWLKDCQTENAEAEVIDGRVVFWGGTLHDGIWVDGDWLGGTIREVIWMNGNFMLGRWMFGDWRNGYFGKAIWSDGVFRNGMFCGWWQGGIWIDGIFSGVGSPDVVHRICKTGEET